MKVLIVLMLGLIAISCASFHGPDRDVASQEDEQQQKKKKNERHFEQPIYNRWDR